MAAEGMYCSVEVWNAFMRHPSKRGVITKLPFEERRSVSYLWQQSEYHTIEYCWQGVLYTDPAAN